MPLFEQEFLKPGRYKIGDSLRDYTRDDLKAYKEGTLAALAAGVPIPLFESHAPIGTDEGYPEKEGDTASALQSRGWLRDMKQREDGTLVNVLDVTDPSAEAGIKNGSIRFTSPELREKYTDGKGRSFGRMIRHIALTGKPRNPDQGPFKSLAVPAVAFGECVQFSLDDREQTGGAKPADSPKPEQEANPDMPKPSGKSKLVEALKANLAELGIVLADGVELDMGDDAANALLSAIRTKVESDRKAQEKKDDDASDDKGGNVVQDQNMGTQFSERELSLLAERDAARTALAGERRKAHESQVRAALSGLPPALKAKLTDRMAAVQFSDEGAEKPGLTVLEVASIVKECLPANLQFDEDKIVEAEHEETKFFSAEPSGDVAQASPEVKALNDQYYRDLGYPVPPQRAERGKPVILDYGTSPTPAPDQRSNSGRRQTAAAK